MGVTVLPRPSSAARAVQASSPDKLTFLSGPISAGWNKIAAANMQTSDKASSLCPDVWRAKGYET